MRSLLFLRFLPIGPFVWMKWFVKTATRREGRVACIGCLTLHPRRAEALASQEDGVVVVLGVLRVALLLHEGPSADVLQAAGRVPPLDEADGLTEGGGKATR